MTYKTPLSKKKITIIPLILAQEEQALQKLQATRRLSQKSQGPLFEECVQMSEEIHDIGVNVDRELYTLILAETQQETLNHGPKYRPRLAMITIDGTQSQQLKEDVNKAIQSVTSRDPRRKEVRQFNRAVRALQAGHVGLHGSYAAKLDEMYSYLEEHYNELRRKLDSLPNRSNDKELSSTNEQLAGNVFGHKLADRLKASKAKAEEAKRSNSDWKFAYDAENDYDRRNFLRTAHVAERFVLEIRGRCRFLNDSLKEFEKDVNALLYDIYQVDSNNQ